MVNSKSLLATLTLVCIECIPLSAQNGINSPYSRYGFGIQSDHSMGFNKGMGGVAQGFRDGQIINFQNPASYSAVDSLTALFDFGITLQNGNFKMGDLQQNAKNSSFDYLAFHFRACRHLGIAVGLLPYSNINYSFESSSSVISGSKETTNSSTYSGDGGLRQAFFGIGWQPFKPISIGANIAYLYGDYTHSTTTSFSDDDIYSNVRTYTADLSTYTLDLGAQYIQPIGKDKTLTLGVTYGFGHDMDNTAKRITRKVNSSLVTTTSDTIKLKNAFQLPTSIAAGITYAQSTKWAIGADFELQKWSECRFPTTLADGNDAYISKTGELNDKIKISLGGMYQPDRYSLSNLLKRIQYKVGAYYSKSYANADLTGVISDKPYEFGLSAGISLPIDNKNAWRMRSKLNITAQWIHTNIPYADNTIYSTTGQIVKRELTENYLRICIGLTFNEVWFNKWKVQ